MGLRLASLRHPNVVVMAPALTEAGQSQNFKLPPSTHSSPASPVSVMFNGIKNIQFSHLLSDDHLLYKSRQVITHLDENSIRCVNGTGKFKKTVLDSKFAAFENLTTLAIASEITNNSAEKSPEGNSEAPNSARSQEGSFMMNQCDPSMGDHEDNMGLRKSNSSVSSFETGSYIKDKSLSDMDQLFKNLGAAISSNDLGASGDLGQNMEELLQVIKNMESNVSESDQLTPEGVGLGSLDSAESGEPEGMFQITDGADLAGGLSTFERELLNDVDMMNMCVDVNLSDNTLVIENKESLIKERLEESRKKQFELERKCEWLIRRLRKLQARTMGRHAGEEVTGVLEQTHRMVKQNVGKESNGTVESDNLRTQTNSDGNKSDIKMKEKVRGISSYAMASLFRKLDMLSQQQMALVSKHQTSIKYFGTGSSDSVTVIPNNGLNVLPKFNPEIKKEVERVAGQLRTQIHVVESAMDSDATASSSGGESCDEMQTFNNPHQMHLSISKRAAWRWAQDRASVASRWTWLQAQISDLEYRIRQHNEIHRQIRAAKGHVCLGEHPTANPATASLPSGKGAEQTTTVPAAAAAAHPLVVNGFHGPLPGGTKVAPAPAAAGSEENGCSRTRPLVRTLFRKRKLLQVAGLHLVSKKAARPASVRCGCQPPLTWCPLCTGRADPTGAASPADLLTPSERIAQLDPCFHPVLSFPEDVPQHIHYEAIMRTSDWQQKTLRSSLKALKSSSSVKTEKEAIQERRNKKPQVEHRRKYTSRLKKTAANTLTAKIKRKLTKGRKPKGHDSTNHSLQRLKRKRVSSAKVSYLSYGEEGEDDAGLDSVAGSKQTSPVPSPSPISNVSVVPDRTVAFQQSKERSDGIRRKRENSYDIDNIVIPYSIAASTRLEKLQYKEIPTPKWRLVENNLEPSLKLDLKNNGVVRRSSQESDVEDLCEDLITARHERCEVEEKKKFMSYIKFPYSGRGRTRRTDSRAESSGANTPDPMSPNNMLEHHADSGSVGSPMTSPPATPLSIQHDIDLPLQHFGSRKRTMSQSRWTREREETQCITPDNIAEVPPYESRTFPIPEDVYEKMLKCMPDGHPFPPYSNESKKLTKDVDAVEINSQPVSPGTDSTESALGEGEDPNDPEWTVDEEKEFERDRLKTSVKR